ncbi:coiled-coil domain-containing protein 154 isoform X10 [Lemur catta]|uniref:coiled-coil domain-containing protein 154 isoform X10 n=1 Tax=Lemur catta TaxID=9447 RepID=UPI001E26708C|nr:coiled-coil domain-containing protein 154 isoform X10 [Lemur catta]
MLPTPRPARPPPPSSQHPPALGCCGLRTTSRATAAGEVMSEPADSGPSSGASPPSQVSTVTSEDLGLLAGSLASPEPWSLETSERDASGHLASTASVPEQDSAKHWKQLEQWVSSLQAEVACLRGQEERREHATLGLLRELLQVRALVRVQDAELQRLQQEVQRAAPAPEKETPEPPGPQSQNQMQALDQRLVEVREALRQVRRQTLQDSERKDAEQEMALRVAKLTDLLRQEEQSREAACSALQRGQEDASQRVGHEVARMQAQVTTLGEEMSLRFLKREAKLCGFLQKSFLALEKRMKAAESSRLRLEGRLREELEGRWGALRELMEERLQAQCGLCKAGPGRREDAHLLEQCRGLDAAVVQLTKFVQQNQASLNRVLLAEQKALEAKGRLQEGQAEELASQVQEGLEAARRALQETCGQLAALREKSQVLEASVAQLAAQLKDLSDQFLTLSCRLDLQGQVLGLRLSEAKTEWEGAERKSLEDLARWQKEVAVQLQGLWEKVDGLPRQIEGVSDKCVLHKSDSDIRISAEGRARESEVGALRRELAALLSAVQLLKEDNPGRKIAEMQGRMATFQNQIIKLENSIQANRTIQNLQFNTETKLRAQKMAALRDSARLWGEEGPWARALGSRKAHTSPGRQRFFVKDVAPGEVPVNRWGVYQATRWLQWKVTLLSLVAQWRPGGVLRPPHSGACVAPLAFAPPTEINVP